MKKAYIIPEIQIYDADAEEMLAGSPNNTSGLDGSDTDLPEDIGQEDQSVGGSCAKQGDFFCDNFEYELDF